jgi:hypothetical protein
MVTTPKGKPTRVGIDPLSNDMEAIQVGDDHEPNSGETKH